MTIQQAFTQAQPAIITHTQIIQKQANEVSVALTEVQQQQQQLMQTTAKANKDADDALAQLQKLLLQQHEKVKQGIQDEHDKNEKKLKIIHEALTVKSNQLTQEQLSITPLTLKNANANSTITVADVLAQRQLLKQAGGNSNSSNASSSSSSNNSSSSSSSSTGMSGLIQIINANRDITVCSVNPLSSLSSSSSSSSSFSSSSSSSSLSSTPAASFTSIIQNLIQLHVHSTPLSLSLTPSRSQSVASMSQLVVTGAVVGMFGSEGVSSGQLNHPWGVAVDDKYVYVAEHINNRVQLFSKHSPFTSVRSFGVAGNGNGTFNGLLDVAVDDNYIYATEYNNARVQIFNKHTFSFIHAIGTGKSGSSNGEFGGRVGGVGVDDDYIYVSDTDNHRVQIFNKTNYSFVAAFGKKGRGNNDFISPCCICVDDTCIYVADSGNKRVQQYDNRTRTFIRSIGASKLPGVVGVAVTSSHIYVSDDAAGVHKYRKHDGAFIQSFGTRQQGAAAHQFDNPRGLAVDESFLFVADRCNHRVKVLQ